MKLAVKEFFMGGVHPTMGMDKNLSKEKPTLEYVPNFVEISMSQSFLGNCKPIVKQGEFVRKGQVIARPLHLLAVPIHASIDGIVKRVDERVCRIEKQELYATQHFEKVRKEYENKVVSVEGITREEVVEAMLQGGLIGMGGAGFPTHLKYQTDKPIHTVLINAAECEPYLTCDDRVIREHPFAVLNGILLLQKAAGAKEAIIAMEDNKWEAADILEKSILKEMSIRVEVLPTKYPQGGERQLIQSILRKEVMQHKLPADLGVIVSNIATAKATADIVLGKEPLIQRIVTVSGEVRKPNNFLVPIGTPIHELLEQAGGVTESGNEIINGGPMTGKCVAIDWKQGMKLPGINKTTTGIIVLKSKVYEENPCIRCGACRQVCPAGLAPFQIDFAYLKKDYALCEELYATECIVCGCCSYICPARRELTERIALARNRIREEKKAKEQVI